LVDSEGVGDETLGLGGEFSLDVVATFFDDPLREHAKMTDEWDAIGDYSFNRWQALTASFDLHQIGTRDAQLARIFNRQARRGATACRQVSSHKSLDCSTRNSARVVDHFIHRNMRRVRMPKHDHSQRITNQQQIETTLVEKTSSGVIVGRESGKASACDFGSAE
jgi:hypothetical protein